MNQEILAQEKKYKQPKTVADAINAAYEQDVDFKYIAGGTDLMVNKFQGNDTSAILIDISLISELDSISIEGNYLKIGPLVKLNKLCKNQVIKEHFSALAQSANSVGTPLIRVSATIGGNILCENRCIYYNQTDWWRESIGYCLKCEGDICIATGSTKKCYSELVSDTAPVLISMDALVEITDREGSEMKKLEEIYSCDGVNPVLLKKTSLVTGIFIPMNRKFRVIFKKLRERQSLEFTSLTSSVSLDGGGRVRVVLAGVDPGPVVIEGTLQTDTEVFVKEALRKARSIDNEMFSRTYRRKMIKAFITDSIKQLANGK